MQETDRRMQETDRQMQETGPELQETGRLVRELGKQIGGLGEKFGCFTEGLALPSMTKILTERFRMEVVSPRVRVRKSKPAAFASSPFCQPARPGAQARGADGN